MKPFHLIAIPHKDIIEGNLTMDVFAADLWEVYKNRASDDYKNPELFFKKTYMTSGLKSLIKIASKKLKGQGGDPIIQIQTPFGGGKTHSLIALYHTFKNPEIAKKYIPDVEPIKAKVVTIVGTAISPEEKDGKITGTLWGEIEKQLEGEVKTLSSPISPGREKLRALLEKHEPVLILMDEVLEHVVKARGVKVGDTNLASQTIAFLQELTETVKSLNNTLLVMTLPASVIEFADEEIAEELLTKLQKVAGRVERIYTPVAGEEIYEVIRRRLFQRIDEEEVKSIVDEFIDYYEREGILINKSQYREKMIKSYPFHPEVIDILHHRWGSIPTFQRTRGVLRILSLVIYRLKDSSIPLIRPCDFDLSFGELAEELIKHIGKEYESVLSADIIANNSNAKKVDESLGDAYKGLKLGTKVATTIFLYSFSGGEVKGASLGELKLTCADINVPSSIISDVVNNLENNLYYLWKENGRYLFKSQPNLNKTIITKMAEIENHTIEEEIKSLLKKYLGKKLPTYIYPRTSKDIPDSEEFKLVILQTDDKDFVKDIIQNYGDNPRVNKNTLFFLCPIESERYNFEKFLREKLAWEKISRDEYIVLTEQQKKDVEEKIKKLKKDEKDKLRYFYRVIYLPGKTIKEIDLGIPTYGVKKTITEEIFDRLKEEKEIVEKLTPILILHKYLANKDYLSIKQLYKALLTTPGEPRISKTNFIKSIEDGVKNGIFGFGILKDGKIEYIKINTTPKIEFGDYEVIIKKELCEEKESQVEEKKTSEEEQKLITRTNKKITKIEDKVEEKSHDYITENEIKKPQKTVHDYVEPTITELTLEVKIPRGKFSEFYRGVIRNLENAFEDIEITIKIKTKNGNLKKSDYELKVKETLHQINAEILKEERK